MKKKIIIFSFVLLLSVLAGYSYLIEPNILRIERPVFKLACIEEDIKDKKIIQISDLHFTGRTSKKRIEQISQTIKNLEPAVIFITGDFISEEAGIGPVVQLIRKISSGRQIYAVFGNWDYWALDYDVGKLKKELENSGVKVLLNKTALLALGKEVVELIGIRDPYTSGDSKNDLEIALRKIPDKTENCRLLLAHSPDVAEEAAAQKIDLVLTGHTHGGQLNIPFITEKLIPVRYPSTKGFVKGSYKIDKTQLYVNRGIGTSVLPLRFWAPPEITVITLEK